MPSRKHFWADPYCAVLDTRIAAVRGAELLLDATNFFAEAGGQESDRGSIRGLGPSGAPHAVVAARRDGLEIVYTLPADHGLVSGEAVRVAIDWPRRCRLMRLHFAAELVLELACRRFTGIAKTGAHIAPDKARIDFAWPANVSAALPALAAEAQALVDADLEIRCDWSDAAAERRYWEIDGLARVPCGGTHVRRTGEIGGIALKRRNVGRGIERIEIRCVDDRLAAPSDVA